MKIGNFANKFLTLSFSFFLFCSKKIVQMKILPMLKMCQHLLQGDIYLTLEQRDSKQIYGNLEVWILGYFKGMY